MSLTHLKTYITSSVMKKQVMGVTGLLLCGFLLSHLAGNCLIYAGPEAFNKYAHTLTSNPLIYLAEVILAGLFFTHIGLAFRLTFENKQARPVPYHMYVKSGRGGTIASSTMIWTGIVALIFIVKHIFDFKLGKVYSTELHGVVIRDLYKTVVEHFASPINILYYIIAVTALGIHVGHGFWSAFQSLGFNHPKYTPGLKILSKLFSLLVIIGYSALPIYCFFKGGR